MTMKPGKSGSGNEALDSLELCTGPVHQLHTVSTAMASPSTLPGAHESSWGPALSQSCVWTLQNWKAARPWSGCQHHLGNGACMETHLPKTSPESAAVVTHRAMSIRSRVAIIHLEEGMQDITGCPSSESCPDTGCWWPGEHCPWTPLLQTLGRPLSADLHWPIPSVPVPRDAHPAWVGLSWSATG